MKANINLEMDKEDLNYELTQLVERIAAKEIKQMVENCAKQMVEAEVSRIISPIVDSYLQTAIVGREYVGRGENVPCQTEVDKYIKSVLKKYLDEPVFLYSKTSNKMSERYHVSDGREMTRAERWIVDKAKQYADTELFEKLDEKMQAIAIKIIPNEERMQEIIQAELRKMVG